MTAGRIRRAWAVLRGQEDPAVPEMQARLDRWIEDHAKLAAHACSLRASLDDHTATIARLSAEAKRRDALMREAHALLGRAITDDGVPQ
jgi:hypothetical protein